MDTSSVRLYVGYSSVGLLSDFLEENQDQIPGVSRHTVMKWVAQLDAEMDRREARVAAEVEQDALR